MNRVAGGITAPAGFTAAGVSCGIKKRGNDLALIFSGPPAAAAGTLTRNQLRAPSVLWAEELLKSGKAQAIVANSGNANCCTGKRGAADNKKMAEWAAKELGLQPNRVLTASTGVIGRFLPVERVRAGIKEAASNLSRTGSLPAAEAIMTTDTRPKEIAIRFTVDGKPVTVGGIAKGSGMVYPNMATMFAFLTTDATADAKLLREVLRPAVDETFNAITVDGEMSTNDMVLLLANGASRTRALKAGTPSGRAFAEAVLEVCRYLAQEIVRDGEGVTRTMTVEVAGARTPEEASRVARQIANSALVKTMVAGRDPNWGRVAAAVGASGVPVQPSKLTIRLGDAVVYRKGEPVPLPHERLLQQVDQPEVRIGVDLAAGKAQAKIYGGDLTEGYIQINAKYTT